MAKEDTALITRIVEDHQKDSGRLMDIVLEVQAQCG